MSVNLKERTNDLAEMIADASAYLTLDEQAIRQNSAILQKLTHAPIMAVVKNNGYGLGLLPYVRLLMDLGYTQFGVISPEEAFLLRTQQSSGDVLLLTPVLSSSLAARLIQKGVVLTISSEASIQAAKQGSVLAGRRARVHIEVDTGFGRYGFLEGEEPLLLQAAQLFELEGVFTHFAEPYGDVAFTWCQFERFQSTLLFLEAHGIDPGIRHCCATGGMIQYPEMHLDMVRIGSGFLGAVPRAKALGFSSAARLAVRVTAVKDLPAGWRVGYGTHYTLKKPTTVAVLGAGATHGCFVCRQELNRSPLRHILRAVRALLGQEKRFVELNGAMVPVLGAVGLNHLFLDVTNLKVKEGDIAYLPVNPVYCPTSLVRSWS